MTTVVPTSILLLSECGEDEITCPAGTAEKTFFTVTANPRSFSRDAALVRLRPTRSGTLAVSGGGGVVVVAELDDVTTRDCAALVLDSDEQAPTSSDNSANAAA